MNTIQASSMQASQASVLFAGTAIRFNLSKGATFADLADTLDQLEDRKLGAATAISVTFNPAKHPATASHSGT